MTKKVIHLDNGEVIELRATENWPSTNWLAEIYFEGWMVRYVGQFASEQEAYQAAVDSTRR